MAKSNLISGLDVGSGHIKLLVVNSKEDGTFEVVSQLKEFSFGVRKGVVIDPEKVSRVIQILLSRAREEAGKKINAVFTNIGGSHLFCAFSRGMVAVSRADQRVNEMDIRRVLDSAETASLPLNNQILESLPKEYIVDNKGGMKDALGMQGSRLEVEALILAAFMPYFSNLKQAVLASNLHVLDIIPSSIASGSAVLSARQKELGSAVLDIGAGTSELAVFEEGELVHLAVFPIGSANITNDIAIGLKTDVDTAEAIKIEKGSCILRGGDKKERVEVEGEDPLLFSQKMLTKIVAARVSEIFNEVQKELKKISRRNMLPAGITLTGGGAKIGKIADLAKKELELPCRVGKPEGFYGLDDELSFATACGLIKRGTDTEQKTNSGSGPHGGFGGKVKKMLKIFIP
ncbi:MAG: cell division protein FtsA [Candidatus Nealsonbacteria bacterium]